MDEIETKFKKSSLNFDINKYEEYSKKEYFNSINNIDVEEIDCNVFAIPIDDEKSGKSKEEVLDEVGKLVGIVTGTYSHIENVEDIKDFLKDSVIQEKDMDSIIRILNKTKLIKNEDIDSVEYAGGIINFKDGFCESLILDNGLKIEVKYDKNGKYDGYICKDVNNSLSIFRKENIISGQYGGTQMTFSWDNAELLEDRKVMSILQDIYPEAEMEDYELLLARISNSGCGYVAMVNAIFQEYEGKEKEFEEKFGYPMYEVTALGDVDFNYEYLILEVFSNIWKEKGYSIQELAADMEDVSWEDGAVSGDTGKISTGTDNEVAEEFVKFLEKEYDLENVECYRSFVYDKDDYSMPVFGGVKMLEITGLLDVKRNDSIEEIKELYNEGNNQIILSVSGYDLYDTDGNLYVEDGGSHAMYVTGINEEGDFIVSSWGNKFICKLDNADRIGYYYVDL